MPCSHWPTAQGTWKPEVAPHRDSNQHLSTEPNHPSLSWTTTTTTTHRLHSARLCPGRLRCPRSCSVCWQKIIAHHRRIRLRCNLAASDRRSSVQCLLVLRGSLASSLASVAAPPRPGRVPQGHHPPPYLPTHPPTHHAPVQHLGHPSNWRRHPAPFRIACLARPPDSTGHSRPRPPPPPRPVAPSRSRMCPRAVRQHGCPPI